MRTAMVFLVLAISALLFAPQAHGQSEGFLDYPDEFLDRSDARTLQGIRAVWVAVDSLSEDAIRYGLTTDRIRTDVKLKLRGNGIPLLTPKGYSGVGLPPYLHVEVATLLEGDSLAFAYSLIIELNQPMIRYVYDTTSHPNPFCWATTWSKRSVGVVGIDVFEKSMREAVLDDLDYFINDWLSVNGPNAQNKPKDGKE